MTTINVPVRVPDLGPALPIALSVTALAVAVVALWRTRRPRDEPPLLVPLPDLPEDREHREEAERRADERKARELALAERRLAFEEAREARLSSANGHPEPSSEAR